MLIFRNILNLFALKNKQAQGFTIIELFVTIAIIGILSAGLIPTLGNYLPGIQLNGTARTLTSNLREAQEKTVTEQKQHLIRFFPLSSPPSYQMIRLDNGEVIIKTVNLPGGVTVALGAGITNNQIVFSADGGPSSSGNITLTMNGSSKIVNVSPAGFIKIQ